MITGKFPSQLEILKKLFGDKDVESKLRRLNTIYETSEKTYGENVARLKGVKFLLIAEAAPWTPCGKVRYFYNTFDGNWCVRLWKAFFPDKPRPDSINDGLTQLAKKGFLLIDALPFAMPFSSRVRKKEELYSRLVKECLPFLIDKVINPEINWAENVKVALAFKLNGNAVISALPELTLPTKQVIRLHKQLIAADRSGYTNSGKLSSIFSAQQDRK